MVSVHLYEMDISKVEIMPSLNQNSMVFNFYTTLYKIDSVQFHLSIMYAPFHHSRGFYETKGASNFHRV